METIEPIRLIEQGKLEPLKDMLIETLTDNMGYFFRASEMLFEKQTPFQDLAVYEFPSWGRVLRLDGVFQTSDKDEFLYHEPLAHIPGLCMNGPKKALVIGGGDGGAIEEILKYPTVKEVVMVELDRDVVDTSKKYLPAISKGAFDNPKTKLLIEDGVAYIQNCKEKFDLVILDLTDPFGPSVSLYTQEFYNSVNNILSENGAFTLHIESPISRPTLFQGIYQTLKSVFRFVTPMLNYVPMYGTLWAYAMASQVHNPLALDKNLIKDRLKAFELPDLQFINENTYFGILSMPNYVQDLLNERKEPYAGENLIKIEEEPNRNLVMCTHPRPTEL
jgi:spermidine synthase